MPKKLFTYLFFTLVTFGGISQTKNNANLLGSFPFTFTPKNNIAVQAILNKKDTVSLMLHTAAESITLIKDSAAKTTSVQWNTEDTVESWGGKSTSRHSNSNTLQIGDFNWENLPIWENKNSGPGTDGKFGPSLFKNKALHISFTNHKITVYKTIPKKIKGYKKVPLKYKNGFIFLGGESSIASKKYENSFLIHSGYTGFILFDDDFAKTNTLDSLLKIIDTKELKDSYGNVLKTQKAILPKFKVGKTTFKNVPIGFFKGAIAKQSMSVLGTDFLKRFDFYISANRKFIYLKPNRNYNIPYGK